ncbi:unnamed protein product, partial [Mesorhabditis belari]|uniref:Proteasome subunit beta n=1 Tax=Mesorhabditis belari TaxID=2138241 RepID=A0AAF3E9Q5_9BILA
MAGMHFLAGIATKDFVILACDKSSFAYGAIVVDENSNKEYRLGTKLTMMCIGEDGDVEQFGDWTKRNLRLYAIRNGYELSPKAAQHWIRKGIADSLRSRDHYTVDILLGGYDDDEESAFLGSIDYLGSGIQVQPYLFRGFPGRLSYAIMDREYRPNMNPEEAQALIKKCLAEAKKRFVANLNGYHLVMINKDGYKKLDDVLF